MPIASRCPQGSVLGPLLFLSTPHLFPLLLSLNMSANINVKTTCNFSLACHQLITPKVSVFFSLAYLNSPYLVCENDMALNPNKSVVILFSTSQRLKPLSGLNVAGAIIHHCQIKSRSLVLRSMPT